jgi:tetratricopeptide (TPR) repeat protein
LVGGSHSADGCCSLEAVRSGVPDWYDDWSRVHAALDALARAVRASSDRDEERWLREFVGRGGWLPTEAPLAEVQKLAAAATEGLDDLRRTLGEAVDPDDPGSAVVDVWYLRICRGLAIRDIARQVGRTESWVKERTGNRRTIPAAWPAIERIKATVEAAVRTALNETSPAQAAAVKYLLSQLPPDARVLVELLSNLAPEHDVRPILDAFAEQWHASYPPVRPVLEDARRLREARTALSRSRLVRRLSGGAQSLRPATAAVIRDGLSPDARRDYVDQLARLLREILDEDSPEPGTWPSWELFADHVPVVCEAALELDADVKDAVLLLHDLSGYLAGRHFPEQAVQASRLALENAKRVWPADHPTIGAMEYRLSHALVDLDEADEALTHADRSVSIQDAQFGAGPRLAAALDGRAVVLSKLGRYRRAREDRERALGMLHDLNDDAEEQIDDIPGLRVEILAGLALSLSYEEEGRLANAIECYEAIDATADGRYGTPEALENHGILLLESKRFDEALTVLLRAKSALEPVYPRCSWRIWKLHDALADTYSALGQMDAADRHRKEAVDINDESIRLGMEG